MKYSKKVLQYWFAILLYCYIAILLYCNTAILLYCNTAILLYCNTEKLHSPMTRWRPPEGPRLPPGTSVWGHTSCRKGCMRHSSAVALSAVSKANIGHNQSEKLSAVSESHSYFSNKTSWRPHGFNLVMWRNSPRKKHKKLKRSLFSPASGVIGSPWPYTKIFA